MSDGETLASLLNEFAIFDHKRTADRLEALRLRLGHDGLDTEEWNALVSSASFHQLEAFRRERSIRHPYSLIHETPKE